ncbi:MAG: PEGA domain-containing protein [Candidatus Eremiobacteraeota bacterium]|nr:PEGA domain-containing protein [Candidatus Eremiobacteraeota bacterium]
MAYYEENKEEERKANKVAGYLLIFLMLIIVGVMIYSIFSSREKVKPITFTTQTPFGMESTSTPPKTPTPEKTIKKTPPPTTPKPTPKPTKKIKKKKFEPPHLDGAPELDRATGNMFAGKTGKVKIIIFSKAFPARSYLIDTVNNTYRSIKFKHIGKKRYKIEIPPGEYRLKIVKKNYFTFNTPLVVENGDKAELGADPLIKRPYLNIKTNPHGARILINGRFAGIAPKIIPGLDDTTYTVTLKKQGYRTKTFKVKLKKGKGLTKSIRL